MPSTNGASFRRLLFIRERRIFLSAKHGAIPIEIESANVGDVSVEGKASEKVRNPNFIGYSFEDNFSYVPE